MTTSTSCEISSAAGVVDDYLARQRHHFSSDARLVELRLHQSDWDVFLHD